MPRAIKRHRDTPLGLLQDEFTDWMQHQGFSKSAQHHHVIYVTQFGRYLQRIKLNNPKQLKEKHLSQFINRVKKSVGIRCAKSRSYAIKLFYDFLYHKNILSKPKPRLTRFETIVESYIRWLEKECHLAQGTCELRRGYLTRFFYGDLKLTRLAHLSGNVVQHHFVLYAQHNSLAARRSMQATLRTFFRYCYLSGIAKKDLSSAIPRLKTYRLSTTPRGISHTDALQVLDIIDRHTAVGKRDYAVIRLLFHYGLRAAHVRLLRLDDIDWQNNVIHCHAIKQGKPLSLPLIPEVGNAILDYLRYARPMTHHRQLFLTTRAPYLPLRWSNILSAMVRRRFADANVDAVSAAHAFRHGFATQALANGVSLKGIADLLGHQCLQTTLIYTKVDFIALHEIPLEIPEEIRS